MSGTSGRVEIGDVSVREEEGIVMLGVERCHGHRSNLVRIKIEDVEVFDGLDS